MIILSTLGPLLLALLLGYWFKRNLFNGKLVHLALVWLTYLILALIGVTIGVLDNLPEKLATAGAQALVFFICIAFLSIGALAITGYYLRSNTEQVNQTTPQRSPFGFALFTDAIKTLLAVFIGIIVGVFFKKSIHHIDTLVTYLLYLLLFLIGYQLRQGNHRLRKLFLNTQGLIIAITTMVTTLLGGAIGAYFLGLPLTDGLAVSSGFGWYSLSGILITGLGNPVLGTTAFLLDIGREVLALLLIPIFSRINSHVSVGYSGATAMDFTLPMLGKFHGPNIVPTAIASGFILSLLVPVLIPLFMQLR
ncbi:lysine exporter LysO family protein [Marinomonas agarivorans]|nr:lysine exporter LysO family protein [Marinomonas agarivorans]